MKTDEIVKKLILKMISNKTNSSKKMSTKFDRLQKFKGEWNWKEILILQKIKWEKKSIVRIRTKLKGRTNLMATMKFMKF